MKFLRSITAVAVLVASLPLAALAASPVASSFSATVAASRQSAVQLQGSDADGTALTYAIVTGPSNGTLTNLNASTGAVIYTPNAGFIGADSFTYTVTSGGDTSSAGTVTLTVSGAKTRVIDTVVDPSGAPRKGRVSFFLTQPTTSPGGLVPVSASVSYQLDAAGRFDVLLFPSRGLQPSAFYQLWFEDSTGGTRQNLGLYDIPFSTTAVNLAPYKVTDAALSARYTFASEASVSALTAAVATATLQSLLGVTPAANALLAYDSSTAGLKSSAVTDNGTVVNVARNTTVTGNLTASGTINGTFVGNGAGLTGIAGGTGGVSNTGSTTIRADSDDDTVGVIDLQARGAVVGLRVQNDGSLTAGVGGFIPDRGAGVFNVRGYGAVGDGVADDTTEMLDAWNAAKAARGTFQVPAGTYKVSSAGAPIFVTDKAVAVDVDPGAVFLFAAGTPTSAHLFVIDPPATGFSGFACNPATMSCAVYNSAVDNRGYRVSGLTVRAAVAGEGGDAIRVDVTTPNSYLHDSVFENIIVENIGGNAVNFLNDAGAGPVNTDSIFRVTVRDSWFERPVVCNYCADSMRFDNLTLRGEGKGFEGAWVTGAANTIFRGINSTAKGGIRIGNGTGHHIDDLYCELFLPGSTGSNNACLDIAGDAGVASHVLITGGTYGAVLGVSADGIRISNSTQVIVQDVEWNIPAGKALINFTGANASVIGNTIIGYNTDLGGGGTEIRGAGATIPIRKLFSAGGDSLLFNGFFGITNLYTPFFRVNKGSASPAFPTTGAGAEMFYDTDARFVSGVYSGSGGSGVFTLQSYSRDAAAFRGLHLSAEEILLESNQGVRVGSGGTATKKITHGVCTLVAGACTVSTAAVTASSRVLLTGQDNNVTGALRVSARSAGVSFAVTSSAGGDTGVVAWHIIEP